MRDRGGRGFAALSRAMPSHAGGAPDASEAKGFEPMESRRDDVEAFASVASLLLEPREPGELADRFLARVLGLFRGDAAIFHVPGDGGDRVSAVGLSAADAARLAEEMAGEVGPSWAPALVARPPWAQVLVAWAGTEAASSRAILALFSSRPDVYDVERDGRLLEHLARHGTAAVQRAREDWRLRELAERHAVQVEQLERIRSALERHSRDLEAILAARGRFFAQMTHELRTPINAIIGYIDLMGQGVLGRLTARQAEVLGRLSASAGQLLGVVNDILDLSKLEFGKITTGRQDVDVRTLVREAVALVELEAARKGLELRVHCPDPAPPLRTDPGRLRQILLNLLSNAVKFTDAGRVTVSVRHIPVAADDAPACRPGADGWVGFAVEDTGPGIPSEELESIFGEYIQLDEAPRGTGLGLAISRHLARILGGELVAESIVGARSTFILYLPCPAPAPGAPVEASDPARIAAELSPSSHPV